jgi:outer membrane protein TolC
MKLRFVLFTALLLVPAGAATAQEPLSLESAIQEAVSRNPSLRGAEAGADAAAAGVSAARSALFPRISFTESWQRGDQPVFVFSTLLASRRFAASNFAIDALNHPDPLGYFHATVGVEQMLFDGGARRAAVAAARAQHDIADLGAREARLAVARNVVDLYGRLLVVQSARNAASAALAAAREDAARAERRRDAGLATDADVLALTVHVADMEERVIQAEGDAAIVRAQLNRLMGAAVDRPFDAVEPAPAVDTPPEALPALLAEAETNRPDLQIAAASQQAAAAAGRSARAAFIPTVAAQAAFDVSGTRLTDRASSWLVGGELRWSLGLGGTERARLKAAAAGESKARADAEDARARVQVEIVTALQEVRSGRARQAVGRAAVAQAQESQRIIRDRFDAGLVPVNDVLRAATAVLDAERQRTSALVDEIAGRAHLAHAVGRLP